MAPSGLEPEDKLDPRLDTARTLAGTEVRLPRVVRIKVLAVLLLGTVSVLSAILVYRRLEDLLARNRFRFSVPIHICRMKALDCTMPNITCKIEKPPWCGLWEWPRRWLSWKGSTDDYHWIWWNPPNREVGHNLHYGSFREASTWQLGVQENAKTNTIGDLQASSEVAALSETRDPSARNDNCSPHGRSDFSMGAYAAPFALPDLQITSSGDRPSCQYRGMHGIYFRTWPRQAVGKRASLHRL
ncbi:hypothetical protein VTN31DRAFT_7171 [Thermomyces dupontii]|uniref:uncharacterized protein n=1 Tax=Talaromyces thermophilus TaxID=28565 RepID=UPI00374280C9